MYQNSTGSLPFIGARRVAVTGPWPVTGSAPTAGLAPTATGKGYELVGADGGVFTFGGAVSEGSLGATHLTKPIVGIAGNPAPVQMLHRPGDHAHDDAGRASLTCG